MIIRRNGLAAQKYEQIVASIPAGLGRRIMDVMIEHVGISNRIARRELVEGLFGEYSASVDRQVRKVIADLQDEGILIISASGSGGYWLAGTAQEAEEYTVELISRVTKLAKKAKRIEAKAEEMFNVKPVIQWRLL